MSRAVPVTHPKCRHTPKSINNEGTSKPLYAHTVEYYSALKREDILMYDTAKFIVKKQEKEGSMMWPHWKEG